MRDHLPEEAVGLLDRPDLVRAQVKGILGKLWQGQRLTAAEQDMDITPAEVAAVWSITHHRIIESDTVRQVLRRRGTRGGTIEPSQSWGSGASARREYRLGDILPVRVQERRIQKQENPLPEEV